MQRQSLQKRRSHLAQATCRPQDAKHNLSACVQVGKLSYMCLEQVQQDDGSGGPGEEAPGAGAVPVRTPFQGAISTIFTKHLS